MSFFTDEEKMGIVKHRQFLVYTTGKGWLAVAPAWFKHAILHLYNVVACRRFGHQIFGPFNEGGPGNRRQTAACSNCSKRFPENCFYCGGIMYDGYAGPTHDTGICSDCMEGDD